MALCHALGKVVRESLGRRQPKRKAFGKVEAVIEPDSLPEEFGFITRLMTQGEYKERVKALGENVLGMIRVKD